MALVEYLLNNCVSDPKVKEEMLTGLTYGIRKDSYNQLWLRRFNSAPDPSAYPGNCHVYGAPFTCIKATTGRYMY